MDSMINRNTNRFAFAFGRRVMNSNPLPNATDVTSYNKRSLDSSTYTKWRKQVAILKTTKRIK